MAAFFYGGKMPRETEV